MIAEGDTVYVQYKGTLDDGSEFDNSEKHGKPLSFTVGAGQVIKGFDDAVKGMDVGQEKKFRLEPAQAYGDQNPELVKELPKTMFPQDQEIKAGMVVGLGTPQGQQIPAMIKAVSDDKVTVDLNPPLAGKTLTFEIKIEKVEKGKADSASA